MTDPFREPWWREGWTLVLLLLLGVGGAFWLIDRQFANLRAQEPEIIYGTIIGEGFFPEQRVVRRNDRVLVRFADGSSRTFLYAMRDMKGCAIGSKVAIEKRGMNVTLASPACPR